jgi:hypothetical protein
MATLSVLVYAVVWCLFRRYQQKTLATFPTIKTHLQRAQLHLAATVGICALFTLFLYAIPTALMFTKLNAGTWAPLYWTVTCLNGLANVFVYSLRHWDIRQGLKLLFTCKELPTKAEERLRKESITAYSATARAAMLILQQMGVSLPVPMNRKVRNVSVNTVS